VVEGHRDVYQQVHRLSIGETAPPNDAVVARPIRDRIDLSVYAIGGDSCANFQNSGRFLEATLENLANLVEGLQRHGYRDADIVQILGANYLRVLSGIVPPRAPA